MVPNSHMDTYACELERSYTKTVGNGRMDGPSAVRSHPHAPSSIWWRGATHYGVCVPQLHRRRRRRRPRRAAAIASLPRPRRVPYF